VLFAVGPLFIFLLMFPITARFFESWFAQVFNFILNVVIVTVVLSFAMVAFSGFVSEANLLGDESLNPIRASFEIVIITIVLGIILWQSRNLASGLAGGVSLASMSLRQLVQPFRAAHNAVDPRSTRRDLQSGHMVTARRHNHMIAGNTAVNPAYRQHVMQNLFKNWGRSSGGNVKR